jgi:hypothetical protein
MASSDPSPNGSDREQDVFGSLPRSRPQRRSAKRDRPARPAGADTPGKAKAKPSAKPRTPRAPAAKADTAARAARPKAAAAKPKTTARAKPKATRARSKPAASATVPPAGYATPRPGGDGPHGTDVAATAVQAAGELAQIGLTIGAQALRSALRRLPRP